MVKQLKNHYLEIDNILKKDSIENINEVIENHQTKIAFFQHERLIHLLVTLAFAILEMLSLIFLLITFNSLALVLTLLFFVLLVPYILHYYFLENYIQKMYLQYDELRKKEKYQF